jgi:hypothetical protein
MVMPSCAASTPAAAAMRSLAGSTAEPFLLAAFPWFVTNPYQALLYGSCREHGIAPLRVARDEQLDEVLELQRAGLPTVLHLHWLHPVLQRAASAEDARGLVDAFLHRLDAYRESGGRVVWTVHNILPHEARFEVEEVRLSAEVAGRSEVIHVLVQGTAAWSDDLDDMLGWATKIGARYMGADRAEEFGRRNAVPGEILVRLIPARIVAKANVSD